MATANVLSYLTVIAFSFLDLTEAYSRCGRYECYGASYCCTFDPNQCCFYIWGLWWFWMLWVLLFTLVISCTFWCRRRRRTNYILVRQNQPIYGTLPGSAQGTQFVAPVVPAHLYATAPSHPQKPPEYTDAKPPEYSPA